MESDLALGNEPLRFRNVSEDVLASKKPPGGLEDACLRFPKRGVELSGASRSPPSASSRYDQSSEEKAEIDPEARARE